MLAHDLLQECQAVHAGHLDIQRDDVRHLVADPFGSDERIAGRADDLDSRVLGQDVAQGLANYGGIVNDQYANSRLIHGAIP